MKTVSQLAVAALATLCAGTVHAQTVGNSCTGYVDAPSQGVHAPVSAASPTQVDGVFWPPNHKLRTVTISAENQNGKPCDVTITDARQDEAVDEPGSGNTSPDAANCSNAGNDSRIDLRGERAGTGTGRFYTIAYKMKDPDFPVQDKMGTATLIVPHDQGVAHVDTYVNEGPAFPSYSGAMLSCS
jgi:hypothetical protein